MRGTSHFHETSALNHLSEMKRPSPALRRAFLKSVGLVRSSRARPSAPAVMTAERLRGTPTLLRAGAHHLRFGVVVLKALLVAGGVGPTYRVAVALMHRVAAQHALPSADVAASIKPPRQL